MIARALTIAGSDSGGGAGIQQDLKTFHAQGVWGMSAITAVTVQNTRGVHGWHAVPTETIAAQIRVVADDIGVDAAKTGMLAHAEVVEAVVRALSDAEIETLVADPVLVATSGDALGDDDVATAIRDLLLPRALLVTPNLDEATALTGESGPHAAARALRALGARAALVTGGDESGDDAVDVLVDLSGDLHELSAPRVDTPHTHGTGCMLSAAICAQLALGTDLLEACSIAKRFVTGALRHALAIGGGRGPVNPGWETGTPSSPRA